MKISPKQARLQRKAKRRFDKRKAERVLLANLEASKKAKRKANLPSIFKQAWKIAKEASIQFGGSSVEYIAMSLKEAYAQVRAHNAKKILKEELFESNDGAQRLGRKSIRNSFKHRAIDRAESIIASAIQMAHEQGGKVYHTLRYAWETRLISNEVLDLIAEFAGKDVFLGVYCENAQ